MKRAYRLHSDVLAEKGITTFEDEGLMVEDIHSGSAR
jgi:hypothetical protein